MNSIDTSSLIGTQLFNPSPVDLPSLPVLEPAPGFQEAQAATPEEPGGKRDLYAVSEDGHFIGDDGFVVPRSFEEFFARHPLYVRGHVRRRWPNVSSAEREDRENELLIFLMTLPEKSKFRTPGHNGLSRGCRDRIQTFNPDHAYGASKPRFFNYVKIILANRCISLSAKSSSDPVQRYSTLSLYSLDPDGVIIDEVYINAFCGDRGALVTNYDRAIENCVFLDEFQRYVKTYNPELLVIIRAIEMTDTFVEAQQALGFPSRLFDRARNRLVVLYSCFEKGTNPPRQRKIYRCRKRRLTTGASTEID